MRIWYGFIAGSLVLAGAVAALSQAPKQGTVSPQTVSPQAPTAVSDFRVRPTGDARLSTPITTVKTLNADECTALGGEVRDDKWDVCVSGKQCVTVDNKGGYHFVCLSAAK